MSDAQPEEAGADACLRCGAKTILMADDDICLPCYDFLANHKVIGDEHIIVLTAEQMAAAHRTFIRAAADDTFPAGDRNTIAVLATRWPRPKLV